MVGRKGEFYRIYVNRKADTKIRVFQKLKSCKRKRKKIVKSVETSNIQAKINLASHIEAIVANVGSSNGDLEVIPQNYEREKIKAHVDCMKVGVVNE